MAGNQGPADSFSEENLVRLPLAVALEPRASQMVEGSATFFAVRHDQDAAIINGYVEKTQDNKVLVVQRPGMETWSSTTAATPTTPIMGIYHYPGREEGGVILRVYNNTLLVFIDTFDSIFASPSFTHTGLFPNGGTVPGSVGEVEPVRFEGVPLPDLVRTGTIGGSFGSDFHTTGGRTTASPPLEGVFINTPRDAYFYNTRSNTLTKIVSNYPTRVVGGAAWLNGRFYVMTPEGRIYASGINDPYTWAALDFINAIMNPDRGTGVWRRHTYIMAMGRNSTEWFYDSGAAVGNPLRRVDSAARDFGCLHSGSVVTLNDTTLFVGVSEKSRERGVYILGSGEGYLPKKVSTTFIDKILDGGDIDCAWAFPLFTNGHRFYVLNICCFSATLVYDLDTNMWFLWTSQNVTARTVTSLTAALSTTTGLIEATVVVTPSFSSAVVGDPVNIAEATQSDYNGDFTMHRVLSSTSFTYILRTTTIPTTPATGTITCRILDKKLTDSWTVAGAHAIPSGITPASEPLLLDRTNGNIRQVDALIARDGGGSSSDNSFVDLTVRHPRWDAANNLVKFIPRVELIGDKAANKILVRYSDNDYQNWSPYRIIDMDLERPRLSRQGSTRRRAYEIRHPFDAANTGILFDTKQLRLEALELFTKQGSNV